MLSISSSIQRTEKSLAVTVNMPTSQTLADPSDGSLNQEPFGSPAFFTIFRDFIWLTAVLQSDRNKNTTYLVFHLQNAL